MFIRAVVQLTDMRLDGRTQGMPLQHAGKLQNIEKNLQVLKIIDGSGKEVAHPCVTAYGVAEPKKELTGITDSLLGVSLCDRNLTNLFKSFKIIRLIRFNLWYKLSPLRNNPFNLFNLWLKISVNLLNSFPS